jgi:hypothetical protein
MKTSDLEKPPVWKSKDGEVCIASMEDEHLQRAYNSAEYRYLRYSKLKRSSSEKAMLFDSILRQLEEEASRRGYGLSSISRKSDHKFEALRIRRLSEGENL